MTKPIFFYRGVQFPICARCTGICIGYVIGMILALFIVLPFLCSYFNNSFDHRRNGTII
ncbi:DUF2085 domain-containing protein [Lysinibacillus sp. RS11]|uniref:DUF2085 domain-containing protein n=1 Tax=Lysinibacillus sp. RS11 TaxID=3242682 RepID=UPI0035C73D80